MKLYELRAEYENLSRLASEATDETRQAFEDTLAGLEGEIQDKIHACCVVIRNLEAEADAFAAEEERLRDRRRALDNSADRLRVYMAIELDLLGMRSVRTPLFSVTLQENKARLILDPTVDMPPEYVLHVPKPDNSKIREALERGQQIQGAHLEPSKSVRIR